MPAQPAFDRDPYLVSLDTVVVRGGEDRGRTYVVLEDTLFYPEGGGQPADLGELGGAQVRDVQKQDGEIRHFLDRPVAPGPVHLDLDWGRRFDHMQQHTGQHLLTAVAQERFGWGTTAFHLGAGSCDIELDVAQLGAKDLEGLEEAVATEIRAARAVRPRWVATAEYEGLAVRSRGLPEGHRGDIRLVEIDGLDLNTCGGTHLRSTAEIEVLKLLGTEPIRGGIRLFFAAGGRVRRRLGEHETRTARLRGLLGAPDGELAGAVEAKLEQLRGLERRCRSLEEDLASALGAGLAGRSGPFAEFHAEGRDAAFLQKLSRSALAVDPAKTLFLTATAEGRSCFLLSRGEAAATPIPDLGREVAALLEAKGGGAGSSFQGKCDGLAARSRACELLRGRI